MGLMGIGHGDLYVAPLPQGPHQSNLEGLQKLPSRDQGETWETGQFYMQRLERQ